MKIELNRGDLIKTNPPLHPHLYGCAVVLDVKDDDPYFDPMCLIGITTTIFSYDYSIDDLDIDKLGILIFDRYWGLISGHYDDYRPTVMISIYARIMAVDLKVVGSIDPTIIETSPLSFDVGDGRLRTDGVKGFPLSGPIKSSLGHSAMIAYLDKDMKKHGEYIN